MSKGKVMKNNNKIVDELKVISPLLIELKDKNPYKVSSSYLTMFAKNVLNKIRSHEEVFLKFSKENPYSVPKDYFEVLQATIVQKIKQKELKSEIFNEIETISPLLNTISKKPVYSVPDGYLHNLKLHTTSGVKKKKNVFSIIQKTSFIRYMAAAVVTGMVVVSTFLLIDTKDDRIQTETAKTTPGVKQLSEEEILEFLTTTAPAENIVTVINSLDVSDNNIKTSLSTISDKEIQQFLRENGDQDEM